MAQSTYTPEDSPAEAPVDLNATPARQGMKGVHVLWVLIISFLLAAAALLLSWAYRSGDLARVDPNVRADPAQAQNFDSPTAPVRQNYSR
jgi:hypothetical protein